MSEGWGDLAEFKPCVFYVDGLKVTEMILEDTCIIWCPWGPYTGHAVDCGYSTDGRLVAMRIWDDVRTRPIRSRSDTGPAALNADDPTDTGSVT